MVTQYSTYTHKPETIVNLARHDIPNVYMEILHINDLILEVHGPKQGNWPVFGSTQNELSRTWRPYVPLPGILYRRGRAC